MTPEAEAAENLPKRISIVIVSINRAEQLRAALSALGDEHQLLVVDNGSTDHTSELAEEFPGARFIRLPKNFGLTKALNVGIRAADGQFIFLLHDDVRISGIDVTRLADFLQDHPETGAVCPLLVNGASRAPQVRAMPAPASPDPALLPAEGAGPEISAECVSGAAIMFRASFLRALRQIDEHYGNYGSIIDLCAQVRRASRKLMILTDVTAEHDDLESPVKKSLLQGDRAAGTAVFLAKYHGFMPSLLYRIKTGLLALVTFRFKVVAGALSGAKIDGVS